MYWSDSMKVTMLVYKQVIIDKEDKQIKQYHIIDTESYLNGSNKVLTKNVNTFLKTNQLLADVDYSKFDGDLKDFNLKNDDIESFNGIFHALVICVTPSATYFNMYVGVETPLGIVHKKVNCNPIIRDKNTIDF